MQSSASMWIVLILVIAVAVLGYGIVKVRRAREAHRSRSSERAAAMLLAMHQESARPRPISAPPSGATAEPRAAVVPLKQTLQRRVRLLHDNQRLLYLVLRTALNDHVVMVNIRIADLVDGDAGPAYGERETKLRLLLQERLDCIVCSNDLVPLAAAMIYDATSGVPDERVKAEALRELGVRFLRFRADTLPKPAEMRALVLG